MAGEKTVGARVSRFRIPGTRLEGGWAVAVAVLLVYIVLFVVLNSQRVEVNFVFFKLRSHMLFAFVLIAVLSFFAGFFARGRRLAARAPGQASDG